MQDGHQFRILARGAEQKIRGRKWRGGRPGIILFDDIEDDEQVESKERREKFKRWFFRAMKPALRDGGRIRGHGTILHEDSLLSDLMKHPQWCALKYKAHRGFDDFTDILWPEKFPPERLKAIREEFVRIGDAAGYSQEYLNDPMDNSEAYLRRDDFKPMGERDRETNKLFFVGADFAISKKDHANRTSFTVGGKDSANLLSVVDQWVGRWDSSEIIDTMFDVEAKWHPEAWFVENGQIWRALGPIIQKEMLKRDLFLNIHELTPITDKSTRGRAFQKRHRAHAMRYDTEAEWFPGYQDELLRFTGHGEARLDDQFDSTATLCIGLEKFAEVVTDDFLTDEELEFARQSPALQGGGRNQTTGY
jgi:predicted phage terminase large subunit-like protein